MNVSVVENETIPAFQKERCRAGWVKSFVLMVAGFLAVSPVRATILDGETVETTYFRGLNPDTTTIIGPVDSLVGPGIELVNFADFLTIDFSDTNIWITATSNTPQTYFELAHFADGAGTIPDITGVTINPATNFAGFDASRITFDTNSISLNLTGLPGLEGQVISLDLTAAPGPGPAPIPEPSTAALLVSGIALLLLRRARRSFCH
jgi:hypothetical protein